MRNYQFDNCYDSMVGRHASIDKEGVEVGSLAPTSNKEIYTELVEPLVNEVLDGLNTSLVCYGQTGCGKTHAFLGGATAGDGAAFESGFVELAAYDLFARTDENMVVTASFVEIYNEQVMDLLNPVATNAKVSAKGGKGQVRVTEKLKIREHPVTGPFASGKVTKVVKSAADVVRLLDKGAGARHTLPTLRNPSGSSRSHAILALSVKHDTGEESIIRFIDLGGTGQGDGGNTLDKDTSDKSQRDLVAAECLSINKSISSLGKVVHGLVKNSKPGAKTAHLPYRESSLTWMLKAAFGGNSRTVALAVVSPSTLHYEESVATLRWADRAKRIINRAVTGLKKKTTVDKQRDREAAVTKQKEAAAAEEALIIAALARERAAREEAERQLAEALELERRAAEADNRAAREREEAEARAIADANAAAEAEAAAAEAGRIEAEQAAAAARIAADEAEEADRLRLIALEAENAAQQERLAKQKAEQDSREAEKARLKSQIGELRAKKAAAEDRLKEQQAIEADAEATRARERRRKERLAAKKAQFEAEERARIEEEDRLARETEAAADRERIQREEELRVATEMDAAAAQEDERRREEAEAARTALLEQERVAAAATAARVVAEEEEERTRLAAEDAARRQEEERVAAAKKAAVALQLAAQEEEARLRREAEDQLAREQRAERLAEIRRLEEERARKEEEDRLRLAAPDAFSTAANVKRHVFTLVTKLRKRNDEDKPKWLVEEEQRKEEADAEQERLKAISAENDAKKATFLGLAD